MKRRKTAQVIMRNRKHGEKTFKKAAEYKEIMEVKMIYKEAVMYKKAEKIM